MVKKLKKQDADAIEAALDAVEVSEADEMPVVPLKQRLRQQGLDRLRARLDEMEVADRWLAKQLGLTRQNVSKWKAVPEDYLMQVCELTRLKPHEVRPDLERLFDYVKEGLAA